MVFFNQNYKSLRVSEVIFSKMTFLNYVRTTKRKKQNCRRETVLFLTYDFLSSSTGISGTAPAAETKAQYSNQRRGNGGNQVVFLCRLHEMN